MNKDYMQYKSLPIDFSSSKLILDLDALDQNINFINKHSGTKNVRIASKSVRSNFVLEYLLKNVKSSFGVMAYTTEEAIWLRELGHKNILVGYPKWDNQSLAIISKKPDDIILMIDSIEQIKLISQISTKERPVSICIDVDLSLDLPFLRFGVFRSPIQNVSQIRYLVEYIKKTPQVQLVGLMGYEAQIAGIGDKNKFLIQFLKFLSLPNLRKRRKDISKFLKDEGFDLKIINGGGTGSITSTTEEIVVSEITIGSAFYAPTLFDQYANLHLKPALFYSLPVIRKPSSNIYTCFGGGYVASGSLGHEKLPKPFLPKKIQLLKHEGAGEVQTPIKTKHHLRLNDPIFFRYAKAGELCERFNEIYCIRGSMVEKIALTYRGEGKVFI